MSSKSKKLGSLADIFQSENLEGAIRKLKLQSIQPAQYQPRQERLKGVEELARSLHEDGLLQPIVVSKLDEETYSIIAGERRYHAAISLGWEEIECKILNKDEKESYRIAVIENLQREQLSPYEEVEAMSILKTRYGYTDNHLGEIFHKSRSYMSEILSIGHLPEEKLLECKQAGIESKNLLIQAVQADKNDNFTEFLTAYHQGKLRTVRSAKEFNKKQSSVSKKTIPIISPDHSNQTQKLTLKTRKNILNIHTNDPQLLAKIRQTIEEQFKQYL